MSNRHLDIQLTDGYLMSAMCPSLFYMMEDELILDLEVWV